jgi:hypothetical protein
MTLDELFEFFATETPYNRSLESALCESERAFRDIIHFQRKVKQTMSELVKEMRGRSSAPVHSSGNISVYAVELQNCYELWYTSIRKILQCINISTHTNNDFRTIAVEKVMEYVKSTSYQIETSVLE